MCVRCSNDDPLGVASTPKTPVRRRQKRFVCPREEDTFKYNFDHMYHNHIVPYFQTQQVGEFTKGFDFSYDSVRFQVVGVQPEDTRLNA